jgi:hypothetical protein
VCLFGHGMSVESDERPGYTSAGRNEESVAHTEVVQCEKIEY